jgi:hypothetical protein
MLVVIKQVIIFATEKLLFSVDMPQCRMEIGSKIDKVGGESSFFSPPPSLGHLSIAFIYMTKTITVRTRGYRRRF